MTRAAEITENYHMTYIQPHCWWATSLAEFILGVLQKDQPGVLLSGTDVILTSDPWRTRTAGLKDEVPAPRFYFVHFTLHTYDYKIHVEGLLPANLCLVTLLSLEQCSQSERFRLKHVQMVNKPSSFKTKLNGNNTKVSRVNRNIL